MIYENPLTGQYIRFVRGTDTNWAKLIQQGSPREDTLYFVLSTNGGENKLYLGSALIGITGGSGSAAIGSLNDLSDVVLAAVGDKNLLVFNSTTNKWENKTVDEVIGQAVNEAVAAANHLKYRIVSATSAVDTTAADADQYIYLVNRGDDETQDKYDEYMCIDGVLEKVGDWSVDLSDYVTTDTFTGTVSSVWTAIQDITNDLYDTPDSQTGETNPGLITRVGNLENIINNNNYITRAEVGDLSRLVELPATSSADTGHTLVDQVNRLTDRLTWYEIADDGQEG